MAHSLLLRRYDAFREEFWRTLCFGDFEAFDHPVACAPSSALRAAPLSWPARLALASRALCSPARALMPPAARPLPPVNPAAPRPAGFVVGTSDAEDPVRAFTDLARPSLLPPILRSGIADPVRYPPARSPLSPVRRGAGSPRMNIA